MVQNKSCLWEILVPVYFPEGKKIPIRFHKKWDQKVRSISGGLTILKPAKGQWLSPEGTLFVEKMIPVRVICTRSAIVTIIDFTLKSQKALNFSFVDEWLSGFWCHRNYDLVSADQALSFRVGVGAYS